MAEAGEPTAHAGDSIKVNPKKLRFIKTEILQETDAMATASPAASPSTKTIPSASPHRSTAGRRRSSSSRATR